MQRKVRALWLLAALSMASAASGQDGADSIFVDVRQGTDMSVTTVPGADFAVIELLGRLWRLPLSGGAALPLTAAEETVRHPRLDRTAEHVVYQQLAPTGWDIRLLDLATATISTVTNDPGNEREPDFLPDGGIVFAADRAGQSDLWSVAEPGGAWQPVSTEPGSARFPNVAENGAIVYVVASAGSYALRIRTEGLTSTLYESKHPLSAPTWRPGGGVVVFQELRSEADARLRMAILSPEVLIRDLSTGEDVFASRVAWLDNSAFFYAADGQIWRRQLAGRARRPVHLFATAIVAPPRPADIASAGNAAFAAPTQFTSSTAGGMTVFAAGGDLWLYTGSELRVLTDDASWDAEPLLAPDASFVVFARNAAGTRRLWQLSLDGSGADAQPLTPRDERAFAASLDPTGTRLAWLSSDAGFSLQSPARLNTLYPGDGLQQRSALSLRAAEPPHWLDDNRTAVLTLTALTDDGGRRTLAFDAGLQTVAAPVIADAAPEHAPEMPTEAALTLLAERLRASQPATPEPYVIQAGRLFDGIGTDYRRHVDIHVEGGRITAVVARGRLPLPATVIDATELTVLPGLIDAHTHDLSLLGELAGRAWLGFGVTTVRSVEPQGLIEQGLPAAWMTGAAAGPRIVAAPEADGRSRDVARMAAPALYDDPFVVPAGESPQIDFAGTLLPPQRAAPVQVLPRRYSAAQRHYQDVYALQAAAGTTEITSIGAFSPGATARLLAGSAQLRRSFEQLFAPEDRRTWLEATPLTDAREARLLALTRFLRAGTRLAVGTESPHTPPGLGVHVEFAGMAAAGIPNDQILRAATSTAAFALGLEQEIGSVEAGRRADLLLVAGDPLADIADATAIVTVIRDGRRIERATLLAPADPRRR